MTMLAPAPDTRSIAKRLERYVSIDSTNPSLGGVGESAMGDALAEDLAALGARVVRQQVMPGRDNVFGFFDVGSDRSTIVLDAHLDTVPASGSMEKPGWRGDTLFGRGACDNKGSLCAMIEGARLAAAAGLHANLVVLGTVDEETTVKGAEAALELVGDADLILVGEPTQLNVGTWHKGTTRFFLQANGRSAHSSMPEMGSNAIMLMAEVLDRIRRSIEPRLLSIRASTGETCKMNIGVISGGGPLNLVPHHCSIGIDVRRVPGQPTDDVLALFDEALLDLYDTGEIERGEPVVASPAFETTGWSELTGLVLGAAKKIEAGAAEIGLPFGTNANRLGRRGAPAYIVGPGRIEYAHTDDEQINLGEVADAARFYCDVALAAPALLRSREPRRELSEEMRTGRG